VCAAFIGLFSIFSFRLIYLQAIKHDEYAGLAAETHVYKQVIHAERGIILDANKEVLAHNVPVETVVADATLLSDVHATVNLLNAELEIPSQELTEKLSSGRRYIVIKRELPAARANALREKLHAGKLHGIYFEHDALSRDWIYGFRSPRHPRR
jgi:cell division protein FtsI/penicillin-binding protein 2